MIFTQKIISSSGRFRMLRFKTFLVVSLICAACFVFISSNEAQDNENDIQQIRKLILREIDGFFVGDAEQVYSCYGEGFIGYRAMPGRSEGWKVGIIGLDGLRAEYARNVSQYPSWWSNHPDCTHEAEVTHVHIKGNQGLAVARQFFVLPDEKARHTLFNSWASIYMITKRRGTWKITGWIGGIESEQRVQKMEPE